MAEEQKEKGLDKIYSELIRKYEIQKETLAILADHPETTQADKQKCFAVIRFMTAFQSDIKKLKDLPF